MRLLILGGTLFLGRHVVEAARSRGHDVTLFNRGTRPAPWPDVETLRGDRDGALDALAGRRWDAVVDPSGYVPRLVGASARLLADAVDHYTYVSSASVYADPSRAGNDEASVVATMDDETSEDIPTHYGALKVLCEAAAERAMPGRVLHVRAGLLAGPFDVTGRFTYWVQRMADDGEVLAPGDPERLVQFIDVRDVAEWIVAKAEGRTAGVYNVTGPDRPLSMRSLLERCGEVAGRDARPTWVDDDFLVANGVAPFSEMPLWLPAPDAGLLRIDVSRARREGLVVRPLDETIRDIARASNDAPAPMPSTLASGVPVKAGISRAREADLLAAWHASRTRLSA